VATKLSATYNTPAWYEHLSRSECPNSKSLPEPMTIFARGDEGFDHFGVDVIAAERIEFAEPEIVTVKVCVWCRVGIAAQVSEELHQHKRAIEFTPGYGKGSTAACNANQTS
jgi:hypothetical protein